MHQSFFTLLAFVGTSLAATYSVVIGIDETNGQPGLGFDPSSIHPTAGDTITFSFAYPEYIKNPPSVQHSTTQSTFESPCSRLSDGFDTGVLSTGSVNSNTGASFNLLVNDTNPIWFFSSAGTDCTSGMVFAVNPPATGEQTAAAFKAKAIALGPGVSTTDTAPSTASETASASSSAPAGSSSAASTHASGTSGASTATSASASAPAASQTSASGSISARAGVQGGAVLAVLGAVGVAVFEF